MAAARVERGAFVAVMLVAVVAGGSPLRASPAPAPDPAPAPSTPRLFSATYAIAWHGVTAGTSTLDLRSTAPQMYLYTSTDRATGIFRVVFPHPIQQSSRFKITDNGVSPLAFQSGGGGPEIMVQFDWKNHQATGIAKGKLLDLKIPPGTQDPLSVQIALMLELKAQRPPASFWMLNTDEIDRFEYVRHEETTLDTPLGKLHTILYTSHQPGSDRTTYLWLAPALDYMPARAEQHVKGNTQVSLEIRAFTRK